MQSGALLQYDWFFTEEDDKEPTVCISTAAFFILFYYLLFRCVCYGSHQGFEHAPNPI